MSFAQQIANFHVKATKNVESTRRAVCIKLFSAIILDTPVGNPDLWKGKAPAGYSGGRLRANWQTTTHRPAEAVINRKDPNGVAAMNRINRGLGNGKGKDVVVWFTNNLPYANRIEFEGWSSQAPAGMVRKNVIRFDRLIKEAIQKGII